MDSADIAQITIDETSDVVLADECLHSKRSELEDIVDAHREMIVHTVLCDAFSERESSVINPDGSKSEPQALTDFAKNLLSEDGYIQSLATKYQKETGTSPELMPDIAEVISSARKRFPHIAQAVYETVITAPDPEDMVDFTVEKELRRLEQQGAITDHDAFEAFLSDLDSEEDW